MIAEKKAIALENPTEKRYTKKNHNNVSDP